MSGRGRNASPPPAQTVLDISPGGSYNLPIRCGCSSVVERLLPKQDIVGSSPITRSAGLNDVQACFCLHLN